jgi:hypothetical protein
MSQQTSPFHNYVDEYMGSAKPFVKHFTVPAWTNGPNQTIKLELPSVSRFLIIQNTETTNTKFVKIAFHENGFTENEYIQIPGGMCTPPIEIKCKNIWLRSSANHTAVMCIMAGCTNIPRENFPDGLLNPTLTGTLNRIRSFTV